MRVPIQNMVLWILVAGVFHPAFSQTKSEEINELLRAYRNQQSFNGTALVSHQGDILLERGYGYRNLQTKSPADSNTIFQIGSLTKQFTAAIILQLQEQHRLSVYDSLSAFLPDFPGGGAITIENLLTHTSGLYNYTRDINFMRTRASSPIGLQDLIALFKNHPPDFKPGSAYSYCNSGYILLGYIIERVTGKSYFQVVRERIFQPLGMNHSGFDFGSLHSSDRATGYTRISPQNTAPASVVDSTVSYSAGAMYTTAGDLYRWDRALYTGKILQSASLQAAFRPFKSKYGYGWLIDSAFGKKVEMHEGSTYGFVSFIARIPEEQTCIILLDNLGSPGLPKIAENINAILHNEPYDFPRQRPEIILDSSLLKQYTGVYRLYPEFTITISLENGQLMAQGSGQGPAEIFAEKEDHFFFKLTDAQIEFIKSPQGSVERLILYQGGEKMTGIKIK